jgi:hypothetical protein
MATNVPILDGPYGGMSLAMDEPLQETIGLGISNSFQPDQSKPPFALAFYRLDQPSGYRLFSINRFDRQPFVIVYSDGPMKGERPSPQPIQMLPPEQRFLLNAAGNMLDAGRAELASVAIYGRDRRDGDWKYYLKAIDSSPEALAEAREFIKDQAITNAINGFYENPNYAIYKNKPTDRHVQVAIQVGRRRAEVDEKIAPLIEAVWRLDLDTMGSCEARPEDYQYPGMAYIWFPRLKDAKRFEELLKNAGIECTSVPKQAGLRRENDQNAENTLTIDGANIVFAPSDIERILEVVQAQLSRV